MTKLEQAARQALEALEKYADWRCTPETDQTIAALRDALAEQAKHTPYCKQAPMCKTPCGSPDCVEQAEQEPVGEVFQEEYGLDIALKLPLPPAGTKLYAAPFRTKDLTDDEIYEAFYSCGFGATIAAGGRAVIAADREKNK